MSISLENYNIIKQQTPLANTLFNTEDILETVIETNNYIIELTKLSKQKDFDLFDVLGQRNLSGLIGEIFSSFFCQKFKDFVKNPHPDGRPDILNLMSQEAKQYYYNECFQSTDNKQRPIKTKLSPFPYDGIEVKCTIGNSISNYKNKLEKDTGQRAFKIGMSRINYLSDLVWWAHHTHSRSLLGLYYDYYSKENNVPQILAIFYSNLDVNDWSKVSLGNPTSKKTSNTSLNKEGKEKMKKNCLLVINDEVYINKFKDIGIPL
ncbi:hypothetical protein [Neobacillus sp.]|uniref:hypothetical protein n=1 Tax=Neobacillus sp. TaxID=2675273 RepID=UPI0035B50929